MKLDAYVKALLTLAVFFLGMIALRPLLLPEPVQAQSADAYPVYIEPGTTLLRAPDGSRQVMGKVVVDLRTGQIWGFPTLNSSPYPVDTSKNEPPVSRPLYLGKFELERMQR